MAKKIAFCVKYSKVEDYKTALNSFIDLFNDLITNKDDCIKVDREQYLFNNVSNYLLTRFGKNKNNRNYYDKKLGTIKYISPPGNYVKLHIEIYPDDENQHAYIDYELGSDDTAEITISFSTAFDKSLFNINYMKKYITKIWTSNDFVEFMNNLASRHKMELRSINIY